MPTFVLKKAYVIKALCILGRSARRYISRTYKDSLNLPKTAFPLSMKDGLAARRELEIEQACNFQGLYEWQKKQNRDKVFVLHDGPPYANGKPHMGHALNKILKDVINRYKLLQGYKIHYKPGWDCHGMPIEHKVLTQTKQSQNLTASEVREQASKLAKDAITDQMKAFQRWGVMADWQDIYCTFSKEYQVDELEAFYNLYEKGLIYQDYMPVYWSPSAQTALAEAELEYQDQHQSTSVHVKFPVTHPSAALGALLEETDSHPAHLIIWTTTPWTLPANKAVGYSTDISYLLVRRKAQGETFILASAALERLKNMLNEDLEIKARLSGDALEGSYYSHPLYPGSKFPLLKGGHVTEDKGTGLVHTAPAHGPEDFQMALKYSISVECFVDEKGCFTKESLPPLQGLFVLNEGSKKVMELLGENIIHSSTYHHSYPYDWRTKQPVILRASQQWFIDLKKVKQAALASLEQVKQHPSSPLLHQNLESRPYWCVSRQRVWGLPVPVFYHEGKPIVNRNTIEHLKSLFSKHGADCWWTMSNDELFPDTLKHQCNLPEAAEVVRGQDILDIWFDSGLSWHHVLKDFDGQADLYIEGTDQYGAWFQTSLVASVALQNKSPYKNLVVHGFAVDEEGKKMSKSVGNVIDPNQIINGGKNKTSEPSYGADVLRWWAVSSGLHSKVHVGPVSLDRAQDNVWQLRKSLRYLMGNLNDFEPKTDVLPYDQLFPQDQFMLHRLHEMMTQATEACDSYMFSNLVKLIVKFNGSLISKFYLHLTKDRMYCNSSECIERRACQTVQWHLLTTLTKCLAPVLPHMCEEAFQFHPLQTISNSVFKSSWPNPPNEWYNPQLAEDMNLVFTIKNLLNENIGVEDPIEFDLVICMQQRLYERLQKMQPQKTSHFSSLTELLHVSTTSLLPNVPKVIPDESQVVKGLVPVQEMDKPQKFMLIIMPAEHFLCGRCRHFTARKNNEPCERCIEAMSAGWEF